MEHFFKKIFLERGKGGKREGEKHRSVASPMCSDWGQKLQPRHVRPFGLWNDAQPPESQHSRQDTVVVFLCYIFLCLLFASRF